MTKCLFCMLIEVPAPQDDSTFENGLLVGFITARTVAEKGVADKADEEMCIRHRATMLAMRLIMVEMFRGWEAPSE